MIEFGSLGDIEEEQWNTKGEGETTLGLPILDMAPNVNMQNIPP